MIYFTETDFNNLLKKLEGVLNERLELNQSDREVSNIQSDIRTSSNSLQFFPHGDGSTEVSVEVQSSMDIDVQLPEKRDMSISFSTGNECGEKSGKDRRLITFFIWIVKSLALRGFPDLDVWIDKVGSILHTRYAVLQ